MRRNRSDNPDDAAVAVELAAAERAVRRAIAIVDGRRRTASADYDARRVVARTRRDLERCIEALRSVRPVGTVGDDAPGADRPVARRTPTEVAE